MNFSTDGGRPNVSEDRKCLPGQGGMSRRTSVGQWESRRLFDTEEATNTMQQCHPGLRRQPGDQGFMPRGSYPRPENQGFCPTSSEERLPYLAGLRQQSNVRFQPQSSGEQRPPRPRLWTGQQTKGTPRRAGYNPVGSQAESPRDRPLQQRTDYVKAIMENDFWYEQAMIEGLMLLRERSNGIPYGFSRSWHRKKIALHYGLIERPSQSGSDRAGTSDVDSAAVARGKTKIHLGKECAGASAAMPSPAKRARPQSAAQIALQPQPGFVSAPDPAWGARRTAVSMQPIIRGQVSAARSVTSTDAMAGGRTGIPSNVHRSHSDSVEKSYPDLNRLMRAGASGVTFTPLLASDIISLAEQSSHLLQRVPSFPPGHESDIHQERERE